MTFLAVQADTPGAQQFLLFSKQKEGWALWARVTPESPDWHGVKALGASVRTTPELVEGGGLPTLLLRVAPHANLVICRFSASPPVRWVLPERVRARLQAVPCDVPREQFALWFSRGPKAVSEWLVEPRTVRGVNFGLKTTVAEVFERIEGLNRQQQQRNLERVDLALRLLLQLLDRLSGRAGQTDLSRAEVKLVSSHGREQSLVFDLVKHVVQFESASGDSDPPWLRLEKLDLALYPGAGGIHRALAAAEHPAGWYVGYRNAEAALDLDGFVRLALAGGMK